MIRERILFDNFVLPFMIGMAFVLVWLTVGFVRILKKMPKEDLRKFFLSFLNPKILTKDLYNLFFDCLIHVKIFKRNKLLGYMHMSIAFGWFMLILIGHIEVFFYTPERLGLQYLYYPVFFRYFTIEAADPTMKGAFFFFLMDFFLLMVLSGILLAIIKRTRSLLFGMRRTTKLSFADRIGLFSLWCIFPLRLLAESFTAGISGGSFLTKPMNFLFGSFLSNDYHILPTWWAYSIALGTFMCVLPFTRYMHIPTEILLILLRNAGIRPSGPRYGFAEAAIYSCPSCGLCIDACPMNIQKKNLQFSSVYFIRFMRRNNFKKVDKIADKCLQCGKCVQVCPVGIDSCALKIAQRGQRKYGVLSDFSYLQNQIPLQNNSSELRAEKVLYYAGCMTQLSASISKSVVALLKSAGVNYSFLDKDGGMCCGRPLMLAGRIEEARQLIERNTELIESSGATMLLVSCPICYKIFTEEYNLSIPVVHHTVYFNNLIKSGVIKVRNGGEKVVYHDPCELGRGCNIYDEPRELLSSVASLVKAKDEKELSICCGGSLGSISLTYAERNSITQGSLESLMENNPDKIVTACPLCLKTFSRFAEVKVEDVSEVILRNLE